MHVVISTVEENMNNNNLIIVAEDDDDIAAILTGYLRKAGGFVNGMVASHLLCHSGTINRHSLNGALLS